MRKIIPMKITIPVIFSIIMITYFYSNQEHESINNLYSKYENFTLDEVNKMPKYDRPDLAVMQNYEMTKDPSTGEIPTYKSLRTFQRIKEEAKGARGLEGVLWSERGPNNVGGRTRAVMYDPNDPNHRKVWAGGVAGGLWYMNDISSSSEKWTNVNDFWANLAITSLVYDPSNTQIFYAGTGEGFYNADAVRGDGIWKSTDGGGSWNQLLSTSENGDTPFQYIQKIVVTSSGTVLAATRYGIYRSIDGGNSWNREMWGRIADLEISKNGDIYAGIGIFSNTSIYKSANDGEDWDEITPEGDAYGRVELALAPSDNDVIYAVASSSDYTVAWFKKSEDGGSTWEDLTIPPYYYSGCSADNSRDFARGQVWYDLIIAVHPTDPDLVVLGGVDLYKTTDGGDNWSIISAWVTGGCKTYVHADQHAIQFNPDNYNEAIFGNDGGVFLSTNVGVKSIDEPSFVARVNGYNTTQFYAGDQENQAGSNVLLAGTQDNGTQLFSSDGINSTFEVTGGDGAFCHIDQNNSDIMISSYVYNNYYRSLNGGSTFSKIVSNSTGRFINPTDYDDDEKNLYAASGSNQLLRVTGISSSSTSTTTFDLDLEGGTISALKVDPYQDNIVWVATDYSGDFFKITDADSSDPEVSKIDTDDIIAYGYASSIDIGSNSDQIVITYSNYGVNSIWETRDGGQSWDSREGNLPDIPVRWALYNPNNTNEVLLATDLGVWSTDEFDSSDPVWEVTNVGLANVRCDMLQYRSSDGQVMVSTHGRGVYTSFPFQGGAADDEAPTEPGNLVLSNMTSSSFTLSWIASSDNRGVRRYHVYVNGQLEGSTSSTSYSFAGLSASTSYTVGVVAEDLSGNLSSQNELIVTTFAAGACPSIVFGNVSSYTSEDKSGDYEVQENGDVLYLENNTWKSIDLDYEVTSSTVLEFDFKSSSQGEMHGIGFDNDETTNSEYTFLVWGTQSWAIQDFKTYSGISYVHYEIPVGDYYQGSFDRLFFVNDYDAGSGNTSFFKNVTVHEGNCLDDIIAPTAPGDLTASNVTSSSFDISWTASTDDVGVSLYHIYLDGQVIGTTSGTSYSVTGLNVSTTYLVEVEAEDNIGEFSDRSELSVTTQGGDGTCPAIVFNEINPYTTQDKSGDYQIQDGGAVLYLENNTWKSIEFNYQVTSSTVLEFDFKSSSQGELHGIGFDNDESTSTEYTFLLWGTQSWAIQDFKNYSGSSYIHYVIPVGDYYQGDFDKLFFVNDHDAGSGNTSFFRNVKVHEGDCSGIYPTEPGDLTASNVTSSSFDLSWSASIDATGISLYHIYLEGQVIGTTSGTSYSITGLNESTTYVIEVEAESSIGEFSERSELTVTTLEEGSTCPTVVFDEVDSYSSEDKAGDYEIQEGGDVLYLENNMWKSIDLNYEVTGSTVIEFDFKSSSQGEMHGIGFDNDETTNSEYTFLVWGTQNWAIQDFNNYSGSSYIHYVIPVGDYYQGSFDRLFFVNDYDAGSGNNSFFRDVMIHEGDCGSSESIFSQPNVDLEEDLNAVEDLEFSFYPNPVVNEMMLEHSFHSATYQIRSINGSVVQYGELSAEVSKLRLDELNSGVYILNVNSGNGKFMKKFIKK